MARIKQCEARGGGTRGKEPVVRKHPEETRRHLRRRRAKLEGATLCKHLWDYRGSDLCYCVLCGLNGPSNPGGWDND